MCRALTQQALLEDTRGHHRQMKRRSADVGGLRLAVRNNGQGRGWAGSPTEIETKYAELLSDMYNQTLNAVNEHDGSSVPNALPKTTRSRLIRSLDCWHFEPHKLSDEEVLASTFILFEGLYRMEGMEESVGISLEKLSRFLCHLRKIYRYENQYHNYEHALDVLQATQCYLVKAQLVPPITILLDPLRTWKSNRQDDSLVSLLRLRDIFAIYLAAIGHDVGHPGLTNLFMKNAQAPLSDLYERSALENMHCQLLIQVMKHHGLGGLFDDPIEGHHFRTLLSQTILATDMSVHNDFMRRFQEEVDGQHADILARRLLVSQALLKNADISNPSRPFPVACHWATALMEEWLAQKKMEEFFSVETSVHPSSDSLGISKSQIFFISTFAKPLLDITVKAVPELGQYAQHCSINLEKWKARKSELESGADVHCPPAPCTSPRQPMDFQAVFPLTLPHGSSIFPASYSMAPSAYSDSMPTSPSDGSSAGLPAPDLTHPLSRVISPTDSESSGSSGRATTISTIGPLPFSKTAGAQNDAEAIRAVAKMGTRQPRRTNRSSWCVQSSFQQALAPNPFISFSPTQQSPFASFSRDGPDPLLATAPSQAGGGGIDPLSIVDSNRREILGGRTSIARSHSEGIAVNLGGDDLRQE